MNKKIILTTAAFFILAVSISAQPVHRRHKPRVPPSSSRILTPKTHPRPYSRPYPHTYFYFRYSSAPVVYSRRPATVYRSYRYVYRDPAPIRRDLPLTRLEKCEYVYEYDCSIRGTVEAIDPTRGTLVVNSDGETLIVAASASTRLFKDKKSPYDYKDNTRSVVSIGIGDIRKGDFVGISVANDGDITLNASIVHVFDLTE